MSDHNIAEVAFGYVPNKSLALAGAVVYITIGAALLFRAVTSRTWWALCLPIGSFCLALGFVLRYLSDRYPNSTAFFAVEQLLILCSPAAFLAFNYITYGRLISSVGAEHSIMNPRRVATIFIISDVFTFLLQATGGALTVSEKLESVGEKITLVGLILQAVSYGFFCILLVKSHISIKSNHASLTHKFSIILIWILYFSSAFLSLRCIYRVVEFAQGQDGYLLTHEVFLYALDALPLLLAIVIYIPWWPAKYIGYQKHEDSEKSSVA